ncbi:MAG: hypothetical protein R3F18_06705 [Lysobacterales bacterium]
MASDSGARQVYMVRYADDAVLMFEHEEDAVALRAVLETSLALRADGHGQDPLAGFRPHTAGGEQIREFRLSPGSRTSPARSQGRYLVRRQTMAQRFPAQPDARP